MSDPPPYLAATAIAKLPIPISIKHVLRFVLHTIVGILLFAVVGAGAMVLSYLTGVLENAVLPSYIVYGVQGLEFFLFSADFICLAAFITKESIIFVRETWLT